MKEDLFISFQINIILSIIVVLDNTNDDFPSSIDSNEGRSIALLYIYMCHTSNYKGTTQKTNRCCFK